MKEKNSVLATSIQNYFCKSNDAIVGCSSSGNEHRMQSKGHK